MEQKALDRIYSRLNSGKVYGEYLTNVRFPCFYPCLSCDGDFIHWRHFGTSANRNSRKELAWILEVIFQMSAVDFEKRYYCQPADA